MILIVILHLNWEVEKDLSYTDHRLITTETIYVIQPPPKKEYLKLIMFLMIPFFKKS